MRNRKRRDNVRGKYCMMVIDTSVDISKGDDEGRIEGDTLCFATLTTNRKRNQRGERERERGIEGSSDSGMLDSLLKYIGPL